MPRDIKLYLEDILSSIEKIIGYTKGILFKDFIKNSMVVDAVLFNLQIIGEAAKHLPDEFRNRHKEIEWRKVAGFRDMIAHEYFGVSMEIVWDIIQNNIPELKKAIEGLLDLEDD